VNRRSWILFAAMCVIWGIPYLLIRIAVRDLHPGTLVFFRTSLGGLVLLPFALRAGGVATVLRHWRPLVAFTALEIALPWLLLGDAEQHLSSSLTGLLIAAVPLVGMLAARLTGDADHVDARRWAGLLLGLAGVALLVGVDVGGLSAMALGEVALVVIGYATAPIILAKQLAHLPSYTVICASLLIAAIAWAPYGLTHLPGHVAGTAIVSIVVLGLICTALAFIVFFALIAAIGPARSTVITYVNPAVALLLGVVLLDEPFTIGMAVGFPLILAGSILATRGARPAAAAVEADQSIRTSPDGVEKIAVTTPVSPSTGSDQLTVTPSSG
jgi:drug/metabolite transporter (DMT)-like permease